MKPKKRTFLTKGLGEHGFITSRGLNRPVEIIKIDGLEIDLARQKVLVNDIGE